MLFHLISYALWAGGIIGLFLAFRFGYEDGANEIRKFNRPVCKYEVLTIPIPSTLRVIEGHELDAVGKFAERQARKLGIVLCDGSAEDGYQVIIRNTVDGWHKVTGWEGRYWSKFIDSTDTVVGFVALSDPDFHTKILKLQDQALSKAAVLESVT